MDEIHERRGSMQSRLDNDDGETLAMDEMREDERRRERKKDDNEVNQEKDGGEMRKYEVESIETLVITFKISSLFWDTSLSEKTIDVWEETTPNWRVSGDEWMNGIFRKSGWCGELPPSMDWRVEWNSFHLPFLILIRTLPPSLTILPFIWKEIEERGGRYWRHSRVAMSFWRRWGRGRKKRRIRRDTGTVEEGGRGSSLTMELRRKGEEEGAK